MNRSNVRNFGLSFTKVKHLYFLGLIPEQGSDIEKEIYARQYLSCGAMISFDVKGF